MKIYIYYIILFEMKHLYVWTTPKSNRLSNRNNRYSLFDESRRILHRRQRAPPSPHDAHNAQLKSKAFMPNLKLGPKRTEDYDPSYGYEPYWEGGGWVYDSRPKPGDVCGSRCNPSYADYGVICARDKNWHYQTFKNFCAMRNDDCTGHKGWLIAYRGECQPELALFPTKSRDIVSRSMQWLTNFTNRYYTYKKKHIFG